MNLNPEKMNTLIKKTSFNYLLNGVQLTFGPDKITSKMISPNKDFAVSIDTQSNDVLMNGGETVKFNLYMNGVRSRKTLDEERENGLTISEKPKMGRMEIEKEYNKRFNKKADECDVEITDTDNPAIREFKFDSVDKKGKPNGTQTLVLVDDDHDSIRGITFEGRETPEPFFTCDLDEEHLNILLQFGKKFIHSGKYAFLVMNDMVMVEEVQFGKPERKYKNNIAAAGQIPLSIVENKFGIEFGIRFNYRNLLHVLDVLKDKEYELQLFFADPEERTEAGILVKSKDGEESYYILNCEIVLADYDKRFMAENDEDFLPKIETGPEIPENWVYTESVEKTKEILSRWKDLSNDMLTEIMTAKKILKKTPSERAQIMHGTYVGWMTWTQYCRDIGHSTQVVNRWLKRAFGDESQGQNIAGEPQTGNGDRIDNGHDYFLESAEKVMGEAVRKDDLDEQWAGRGFIDILNVRKKKAYVEKLIQSIDNQDLKQAVVLAKNIYTDKDWFKPLYDGLICFTNHGNGGNGACLVYFGEEREQFLKEFSQYGVIMQKLELEG